MEREICRHFMYGYCKFKENCMKQHVKVECKDLSACKSRECVKRHPKVCKRFSEEKFCKFKAGCAHLHSVDQGSQVQQQKYIQNELKIKLLEEEVIVLKFQILQLGVMTRELTDMVELVTGKKSLKTMWLKRQSRQRKERSRKKTLWGQKLLKFRNISVASVIPHLRRMSLCKSIRIQSMGRSRRS